MPLELKTIDVGHYEMTQAELQAVMDVCASEQLSPGPYVAEFEDRFSARHGAEYGVMVNSGTDALRIALHALKIAHGWKDGDAVIVPSVTFVATINVVLQLNLKPILVDIDPKDYGICPPILDSVLLLKRPEPVRAIIVANLFGQPATLDKICEIAKKYDLKVIEDSCETMGVNYGDRPVGSWGDIGCFSFYMAHLMTTGVGGMAITSNPDYEDLMRSLANHGRDPYYIPGRNTPELSKELIMSRFRFLYQGYSCRATEFEAAIGLCQLENLNKMIAKRQKVAASLLERLAGLPLALPLVQPNRQHAYMMFPVVLPYNSRFDKWDLCLHLERNGIKTRDMLPIINQPCYKGVLELETQGDPYPGAKWIDAKGFYIGCHPGIEKSDVEWIGRTFESFFSWRS